MSKICIVTGAGSGIGRSAALHLAKKSMKVVLAGRNEETLRETAILLEPHVDQHRIVVSDVTQPASVTSLFERTVAEFGRVDVLFNNAGINVPACPLDELSLIDWQNVVDVNLTGAFLCTQAAFRTMKNQNPRGGRIINNGSISAHIPRPGSVAYTATKHAITGLTRATSLDGRAFDIACGQIDIGNASTSMTSRMSQGVLQADGSIASEPTIDVDQVGKTVAYLADLPIDVNVPFMTIMANKMPYMGRG